MNRIYAVNMIHENKIKNPDPALQKQSRTEHQAIFIQAALYITIENGLPQLTLQKLAQHTGYSIEAVYRYFASKELLIAALQTTVLQQLQSVYTEALSLLKQQVSLAAPAQSLAQLMMIGRCFCEFQRRAPARFQLLQTLLSNPEQVLSLEQAQPALAAAQAQQALLSKIFDQAQATQALNSDSSEEQALIFWAALQGVLNTHKLVRFRPELDVQQLGHQTLRLLLLGWQAPTDALEQAENALNTLCRSLDFDDLFAIIEELD